MLRGKRRLVFGTLSPRNIPYKNETESQEEEQAEEERDAYVNFLIVTDSTLRYRQERERERERQKERKGEREASEREREREREREARTLCHYYPIIPCITVTVNEVSYYAAYRGGG